MGASFHDRLIATRDKKHSMNGIYWYALHGKEDEPPALPTQR
jgi:hypothetical protein